MSFEYRKEWGESGDLAVRRLWNENMSALANAFTRLDRENFPEESIPAANISTNTFYTFASTSSTTTATLDGSYTSWVRGISGTDLLSTSITMPDDGVLVVNLSWTWHWAGVGWSATLVDNGMASWRLMIDGNEVAMAPRHSIVRYRDSAHLVGSTFVAGGIHDVWMEGRLWSNIGNGANGVDVDLRERELVIMGRHR